jgi:DNA-binding transcriptional LysR family regulator
MKPTAARRAYKEITTQQLRSFCETARLGSFAAAADSLGLSNPTVWKQVHALERELKVKLVVPYGRGCRLTDGGRELVKLAAPVVASLASLKRQWTEAMGHSPTRLTIAASPRVLVDDLPECVLAVERRWPHIQLTLKEARIEEVSVQVETGQADLGFTDDARTHTDSPSLVFEPCYLLDSVLVTPPDHPLARRRWVRPHDLRPYPFVNAPTAIGDPAVTGKLEDLGVFRTEPRRIEAYFAAAIRRYVALGFGIGLVGRPPTQRPDKDLHERVMTAEFGPIPIYLVRRKTTLIPQGAGPFIDTVKAVMGRRPTEGAARSFRKAVGKEKRR